VEAHSGLHVGEAVSYGRGVIFGGIGGGKRADPEVELGGHRGRRISAIVPRDKAREPIQFINFDYIFAPDLSR
jgi:hypothetical protein